jgi:large subunit ribosomal protein L24
MKIRIGDQVIIKAGKDKGKTGKVEKLLGKESKLVVAGINIYKRSVKRNKDNKVGQGGIIDIVKPIPASNVALVCPKCHQATRIGKRIVEQKKKERICRKCSEVIEYVNP